MHYMQSINIRIFALILALYSADAIVYASTDNRASAKNQNIVLSEQDARGHFVFQVLKNITWKNFTNENFKIAVIDPQAILIDSLTGLQGKSAQNRRIFLTHYPDRNVIFDEYDAAIIVPKSRSLASYVFQNSNNLLIITNDLSDKDFLMVNIGRRDNQITIDINRDNLLSKNLSPSIALLSMAGTKSDLSDHLKELHAELTKLEQKVTSKEKRLNDIKKEFTETSRQLSAASQEILIAQSSLRQNKDRLNNTQMELELTQAELESLSLKTQNANEMIAENNLELAKQNVELEHKQKLLLDKQSEINKLGMAIARNEETLQDQSQRVATQTSQLIKKDVLINEQRIFVLLSVLAIVLIGGLAYWFFRTKLKIQTANQKLKELNAQLYEMATVDHLSQLYNRRHFLAMAKQEFERFKRSNCRFAALIIDIDHFKKINDNFGHQVGDLAIESVSKRIKILSRETDIVGRLGGEEFGVLLSKCDCKIAENFANRLCQDVANKSFTVDGHSIDISISIGLSLSAASDKNIDEALNRADKALYRAKENGRNRIESLVISAK